VRAYIHSGECSYVYEYLCLYCVSKKTTYANFSVILQLNLFRGTKHAMNSI
jgi:hypothetical protein